jgi:hypothetical protein
MPVRSMGWAVAAILALSAASHAQSHALVVSVADVSNGHPLEGADVRLVGASKAARTDWIGEARFFNLPVSRQRVQVRMLGYAAAELEIPISGDSSGAIFMLEPVALPLDKVDVKAERPDARFAEFDLHRRFGTGRYLTDSVLAKEGTRPISFVLISHFPGLTPATVESSGRDSIVATQHGGLLFSMAQTCAVAVYLDGIRWTDGLEGIRTEELHGVEYYDITTAPIQYRRPGAACKVLLFWTKP